MQIFVGNLSFKATELDVKKLFEEFGNIANPKVVMDKRGRKSRGFGFIEMPDDIQAQNAINALDGKEFMGRPLNVSAAKPKTETIQDSPETKLETYSPRGGYKKGRRSLSYIKRRAQAGIEEKPKPSWKNKENPMRWRKKSEQSRPWKKPEGEAKPWHKSSSESKPWRKREHSKFWQKPEGESSPTHKSNGESRSWRKPESGSRPYHRPSEEPKSWERPDGKSRPWRKTSDHPQKSRFGGPKKSYANKNRPSKSRHIQD